MYFLSLSLFPLALESMQVLCPFRTQFPGTSISSYFSPASEHPLSCWDILKHCLHSNFTVPSAERTVKKVALFPHLQQLLIAAGPQHAIFFNSTKTFLSIFFSHTVKMFSLLLLKVQTSGLYITSISETAVLYLKVTRFMIKAV